MPPDALGLKQKVTYMHIILAGMLGGTEIMVVVIVALVLFGARKIPEFAKGLGQAVKEFKKASNDVSDEIHRDPPPPPPASK
jgi:sec-independent protein translocase protein TatA